MKFAQNLESFLAVLILFDHKKNLNRLNYFNPQTLGVTPKPDPQTGNVDIEYSVEEKPSDQVELQGGWGAGRVVGTLGLTFNNFSLKNIFDKSTWSPITFRRWTKNIN